MFLHADACAPEDLRLTPDAVPDQLARRWLSLRAFDAAHDMTHAEIIDGHDVVDAAQRLLADPDVTYLHIHNAAPGCFAVRIER